ncbi:hypothetical protein ONZ45_g2023 [Pleurotus djamor]|nr:hypothetical protein ONZ45_g2023 [Pleurotus djamor]
MLDRRPEDWKARAPAPPSGTVTFAAQDKLDKLPVPDLRQTLDRLKESLRPIAWSDEEYAAVEKKIEEFGKGKGVELHERLLKHHAETKHWLEQWWDDVGYMGYRDSVVVNVSYYYGFDRQPAHLPQSPAGRAATLARAAMIFRQNLKQGLIKPEATREGALCMDTYRWMFDCCRVPGPQGLDWSVTYAKEGDKGDSGHIVVFRNNRPWKIEATKDGRILSTSEFEEQIAHVIANSDGEYPGVGVLGSNNRDIWAKDYAELAKSANNSVIIHAIQSAAFTISLDSSAPADPIAHSRDLWHGHVSSQGIPIGLRNRWVDKPCEFIVFDNSEAGFMGEHSVMDGTPTARMCDDVLDMLHNPAFDNGNVSSPVKSLPTPMDWEVSPATSEAIARADAAARELIESQELTFHLTSYGKAAIKNFGVSPDSWAQMIIQLAYRRLIGNEKRKGGTYEAATTRRFYKGRTEAIRVVTSESDAWVKSMNDPSASQADRKKLFDLATKKHITTAKYCGAGQGFDRHLFGLKKMLEEGEEIPALYSDPVFQRSSYWVLSTSAIFSKHFPVYGWGEVVPDGFGVAYMTGYDGVFYSMILLIASGFSDHATDRLQYTITSRKEMPNQRFMDEIMRAADDLYALHTPETLKSKL